MIVDHYEWAEWLRNPAKFAWLPVITRHPMTKDFAADRSVTQILDLSKGITEPAITERPVVKRNVPDNWLRPVTKQGRPPRPGDKVWAYHVTLSGVIDNMAAIKGAFANVDMLAQYIADVRKSDGYYYRTIERRAANKSRKKRGVVAKVIR